jgi:hypothetical protein
LSCERSLPVPFNLAGRDAVSRPCSKLIPPIMADCLIVAQVLPSFPPPLKARCPETANFWPFHETTGAKMLQMLRKSEKFYGFIKVLWLDTF